MSGDSTGQVASAAVSATGVALLPATGEGTVFQLMLFAIIGLGIIIFTSFTLSRIYRYINR